MNIIYFYFKNGSVHDHIQFTNKNKINEIRVNTWITAKDKYYLSIQK